MSKKKNLVNFFSTTIKFSDPMATVVKAAGIPDLIRLINLAAEELKKRNFPIRDWEDKDREFYKVTILGGKAYILLPKGDKRQ